MQLLATKTADEIAKFRLNPKTLGSNSEVIARKCIQRIYGDRAEDIIAAMVQNPFTNIPIVLKRLKQKASCRQIVNFPGLHDYQRTEWEKAQRQWNQIWRETNEKNFLKSLDYRVSLLMSA